MKKVIVALTGLVIILLSSCAKGKVNYSPDCSGAAKTFSGDVSPIISSYCATSGCHAAGSGNGPGALTNYSEIFNARSSIRRQVGNGSMPQNSTLSNSQKDAIMCWIDSDAPNN
jgi:hypothetical protein